jgi:uncharacterized membrane protein
LGRILRIFLAGVLALLPIALTVFVTAWVASLIASYAGPSEINRLIIAWESIGLTSRPPRPSPICSDHITSAIFVLGVLVGPDCARSSPTSEQPRLADDPHPADLQCLRIVEALRGDR